MCLNQVWVVFLTSQNSDTNSGSKPVLQSKMKVQIVLIIALVILNFVQGQNDTTIGCQRAETTIKEVLKSTVEELYQKVLNVLR